ncbi:hypothetical protein F503_08354 [Ophiostoma piceae UAMH 11346]|uniref:Uncharacterized protein n=1 Tax=Ophiostoma piceae (strain UAMH 11346) TaxID=1262450 RepID=S3CHK9_OPHP1|nr:hypothetical protein F503_08354 [Ophiostoma piceae UAMH 11346]
MIAVQTATTTMQVHDELAALLARNLTLGSVPYSMPVSEPPVQAPAAPAALPTQVEQPKIIYSISQHYHHSAHANKPTASVEETQQPQPEQQQQPTPEQVLLQNGIDPTALTDVQLALFKMSAPDRRDYLLQLWRICPPTRPVTAAENGPWDTIDVEMDREIASSELRVQQNQVQQAAPSPQGVMSLDGTVVSTAESAPTQASDGRWMQSQSQSYMEPYMASGYEELARREYMSSSSPSGYGSEASVPRSAQVSGVQLRYSKATDPVYDNQLSLSGRASWPQAHHTATDMENQYGALMAMRDSGDMEISRLLLLALALVGLDLVVAAARGLGRARLLDDLELVLGIAARRSLARRGVGRRVVVVGRARDKFVLVRRLLGKDAANGQAECPGRQAVDRSVEDGRAHNLVDVEEELLDLALRVHLLQVDVAQRVDNQDLAVLGRDPSLGARRTSRRLRSRGGRAAAGSTGTSNTAAAATAGGVTVLGRIALGVALLHAALLAVHSHLLLLSIAAGLLLGGRSGRGVGADGVQVHAGQLVAPGGLARIADVAVDKLALALPAHVQRQVVDGAADKDKEADHDRAEARAVAVVVVLGALPGREAVGQEVVVAVALGAAQDVGDNAEARLHVRGALHGGTDLARRRLLGDRHAAVLLGCLGPLSSQLLLDLVGMERSRLLAVGLVDVVEGRGRRHADKVVEGDVRAEGGGELVAHAEDFAI